MPTVKLSKFAQDRRDVSASLMFQQRLAIQNSSTDTMEMHPDVSHMERTVDLRDRGGRTILLKHKRDVVVPPDKESNYTAVEVMNQMISCFRELYSDDLGVRLGLYQMNEENNIVDTPTIPNSVGVVSLMNVTFGMKRYITGSGLMTESQHLSAKSALLSDMQDIFEQKSAGRTSLTDGTSTQNSETGSSTSRRSNSDSDTDHNSDDEYAPDISSNSYKKALDEYNLLKNWKKKKYQPKVNSNSESAGELKATKKISIGPVQIRGADLPSGKNIADYISKLGRFKMLEFYCDHEAYFPALYIMAQRECVPCDCEVGCERFFNISGYISSNKRSNLGVRDYERIALLAKNLPSIYVDDNWVAKEYL